MVYGLAVNRHVPVNVLISFCLCTYVNIMLFLQFYIAIDCGILDDPANGEVSVSSTTFNSTAIYSCNTGYTVTGDDMRECLENGLWSGSEPLCTRKCLYNNYL